MNKILKKITAVFLAVLLGTVSLAGVIPAGAADGIAIDEINFPDEVFRNAILEYVDKDENKTLSSDEIAATKSMFISGWVDSEIKDLKGIEYFTACENLRITALGLESIDLSALSNLKILRAMGDNNFTSLDLSKNTALYDVEIRGNKSLTSVKLGSGITKLQCDGCSLNALDLSSVNNLAFLTCYDNELNSLDLSPVPNLEFLDCSSNHIKELDLSCCPKLNDGGKSYIIGDQQITASVTFNEADKSMSAAIAFDNADNIIVSTISSAENISGYNKNAQAFVFNDYSVCESGIKYMYSIGFEGAEGMEVHINLEKDFFKVSFLTEENGEEYYYDLVQSGGSVAAPALPNAPAGMNCAKFSEKAENVTQDMTIYVIWSENHTEEITDFKNNIATVTCTVCGSTRTLAFADYLNFTAESSDFEALLDVNQDGYINARDLAELAKKFK